MKSSILLRVWNDVGSRRLLRKSSTNLFLGMFAFGSGDGDGAFVIPDVFFCRKISISFFPYSEKERVAKSKAPAVSKSLNDSSVMVA